MPTITEEQNAAMRQVFEFIQAHPAVPSAEIRQALKLENRNVSGLLSSMVNRKMLTSKEATVHHKTPNGVRGTAVKHYTVALPAYQLLARPVYTPANRFNLRGVLGPAAREKTSLMTLRHGQLEPVFEPGASPKSPDLDAFLEGLTIREAKAVYARLHSMFGNWLH